METNNHYFASANSGTGFINNFKYINPNINNNYLYILKGGPGTGKSTLLKRISQHFLQLGEDIEFFHCSSDPNSLDGIHLIQKNISIIDGTAPHNFDATLPKINSEIIDLSDAINSDVRYLESKVMKFLFKKTDNYKLAYNNLSALSTLFENKIILERKNNDIKKVFNIITQSLKLKKQKSGSTRYLFLNSFTKNGIIELPNTFKEIMLPMNFENGNKVTNLLTKELQKLNYNIILIQNLIKPDFFDALIIDNLGIKISCNNIYTCKNDNINFQIQDLIKQVGNNINKAIFYHKQIEKLYYNYLDFNKLNEIYENLIEKISKN